MRALILVVLAAWLSSGAGALAATCRDAASGRSVNCPGPPAKLHPRCGKLKRCGNTCIARARACHVPG